jgi:hypothetical protein
MIQLDLLGHPVYRVRCKICHRPLSKPESISREMGEVCYRKVMKGASKGR